MKRVFVCIFSMLIFAIVTNAQTSAELDESVKLERQAAADYKAKNYTKFLENIKRAAALRPNHPRVLYNLADAYALNNNSNEALKILEQLAAMDVFFAIEKDDDFKSLFDLPRFKTIQAKFVFNQKAVNHSGKAFTIPNKDMTIEGIAYDSVTKRFFVSAVDKQKIVVIDANGQVSDFSSSADGLWCVYGMRVDEARKLLWVTTNALPQIQNFQKSAVFKYDLRTGKLLKKYILSDENKKHVLGDLIVAKDGNVFASDSVSPNIYRIEAKTGELDIFLTSDSFASLQGLAFSKDEKFLFAADYSKGVFRIGMQDKKILQIAADVNTNPIGIDGLYFHRGNLIAIQNGFQPHRVVRFVMSKNFSSITKSETLEANHADFNEPTLGVKLDNDFYYIANSQGTSVNKNSISAKGELKEPVILRLKL